MKSVNKRIFKNFLFFGNIFLFVDVMFAAGLGIEPKFSLSESDVLPLYDPAISIKYLKNSLLAMQIRYSIIILCEY